MKINATQKKFYRYLNNETLNPHFKLNLTKVTINDVINSKSEKAISPYRCYTNSHNVNKNLLSYCYLAINTNDRKKLRLLYKRYRIALFNCALNFDCRLSKSPLFCGLKQYQKEFESFLKTQDDKTYTFSNGDVVRLKSLYCAYKYSLLKRTRLIEM